MLKAKELLSGVNRTSKVVALMPLLSIHVASELEPICRMACTECMKERVIKERIKRNEDDREKEDREETFCVRLGRDRRIACYGV